MPRFYQPIDLDDAVVLIVPARQRVVLVLFLSLATPTLGFGVLWWSYQWLASPALLRQSASEVSAILLLFLMLTSLRTLLLELSIATLTFERTTIGIKRSVLGIPLAWDWYSCYRIQHFQVTHDASRPDVVRIVFNLTKGRSVLLAAHMPTEAFVQLGHLLRRKQFAYLKQDV